MIRSFFATIAWGDATMNFSNAACGTIPRHARRTFATLLLVAATAASAAASATTYRIVQLPLPGNYYAGAMDINEAGEVVGSYYRNGMDHALKWVGGPSNYSMNELPKGSALESYALRINDAGQVLGKARFADTGDNFVPVRWESNGAIVRLAERTGWQPGSDVSDMNNRGIAVGSASRIGPNGQNGFRPAYWLTPRVAGTIRAGDSGFGNSQAYAVNDSNTIVGSGQVGTDLVHAFRRLHGGQMEELPPPARQLRRCRSPGCERGQPGRRQ